MHDVECILLSKEIVQDEIGVEKEITKESPVPIIKNEDQQKQAKLKQLVEPFILRRTKKDVLTELPDKIENNVIIPFTPEEEKIIREVLQEYL